MGLSASFNQGLDSDTAHEGQYDEDRYHMDHPPLSVFLTVILEKNGITG
jgi:hypothetical protein